MRVLVTAGPTREYIDSVRFITTASSGRMGHCVAAAACAGGHHVTLLTGPVALEPPEDCAVVPFVTVAELKAELVACFPHCDVLVMAAAVGDFRCEEQIPGKLARSGGGVTLRLVPTEDLVAGVAAGKRPDQTVVTFAVEVGRAGEVEAKARAELAAKNADLVVVNTPVAMGAEQSEACILTADEVVLPWAQRGKEDLAAEILRAVRKRRA